MKGREVDDSVWESGNVGFTGSTGLPMAHASAPGHLMYYLHN